MSSIRRLAAPVVKQVQRGFSVKASKALLASSNQFAEVGSVPQDKQSISQESFPPVMSPLQEVKQFDEHKKVEVESVGSSLSSMSEESDKSNLEFEYLLLKSFSWTLQTVAAIPFFSLVAPVMLVIDQIERLGSNLKPDHKKHGFDGPIWIRAEGDGDISAVVSEGLQGRGAAFLKGEVSLDMLQKYLEFNQFATMIGHGGCDGLFDSLRFVLNNHDLNSKNGFLIVVRQDDMLKKDKLFDVNLLEVSSERSYENEIILVGGVTPQEMFAVIKYADLARFLDGEPVTNMLINNPDLKNVKEHICIGDLNLEENTKPHTEQIAKVKKALVKTAFCDKDRDFVGGIPVCVIKYAAEQSFFKKQVSTKSDVSKAPESSNDSSYRLS